MKMLKTLLAVAGLAVATACTEGTCAAAQYCDSYNSCQAKVATGESCYWMSVQGNDASVMCTSGEKCISSRCASPTADGSTCSASDQCFETSFCTNAVGALSPVCSAKVAVGGACADTSTSSAAQCKASYCSSIGGTAGTAGTCTAYKALGATCDNNNSGGECTPGTWITCSNGVCTDTAAAVGAAVGAALGMAGGILAAIIIIPICVCICCCVIIYKVMSKGKGDD